MVDRVIQVHIASKPDGPELWVAFYPVDRDLRRTLFASLERVKEDVRFEVGLACKGESLGYNFIEVPFDSLPFED